MGSRLFFRAVIFPVIGNAHDAVSGQTPTERNASPEEEIEESGQDRLLRAMKPDEFGKLSPEVETVLQVGCMSMFIGALYGGVIQSRVAYMDFFRNNQATVFHDHIEAKKRLQDKVTLAFGRGALRWSWRLTLFTTSYIGIASAISLYRGKNTILEYVVAGTVTGAGYKFTTGPRGWLVGGGLGCVLGLIAGGTTLGLLKLSGLTMQEVQERNAMWRNLRKEHYEKGVKVYNEQDEMQALLDRNVETEYIKKNLDDIETNRNAGNYKS